MVLNGHSFRADGEWAQVSQNDADLDVYEMLACYQDYPNGGNGWLRTIEFVQDGGVDEADRIRVRTYSPTLDRFGNRRSKPVRVRSRFRRSVRRHPGVVGNRF